MAASFGQFPANFRFSGALLTTLIIGKTMVSWNNFGEDVVIFPNISWQRVAEVGVLWQKRQTDRMALMCPLSLPTIQDVTMKRVGFLTLEAWDNLWESRGGSMVNGAPREFPESTQCTP